MNRIKKAMIIFIIVIAATGVLFVFYPSAVMLVNRIAFSGEMKKVSARAERVEGVIYSEKTYFDTEMSYTLEDGYVIDYLAQYAVVFYSGKTLDEIRQTLRSEYIIPLSEADDPFMAWDAVEKTGKPDSTDGYYILAGMPAPKISDTLGAGIHKYIYSDKENRKYVNEQKKYADEYKKEIKRIKKEEKKYKKKYKYR